MARSCAFALVVSVGMIASVSGRAPAAQKAPPAQTSASARAVFDRYCVTCHNARLKTAGLMLDSLDVEHVDVRPDAWETIAKKLRAGVMPPPGSPRPDKATTDGIASFLESALDRSAALHPNPGRPALHRLNRTEYAIVIRDLLALDVDVSTLLPPDDSSYGFDNIADVLKVSPSLLERYLAAARRISRIAVGDPRTPSTSVMYSVAPDLTQDNRLEGLPFGTRGGTTIRHTFPLDAEYTIRVRLGRTAWGSIRGMAEKRQLDVRLDGRLAKRFDVGGIGPYGGQDAKANNVDAHLNVQLLLAAGPHEITVTFPKDDFAQPEGRGSNPDLRKPFVKSNVSYGDVSGLPLVHRVFVEGPFTAKGSGDTPSRRRVFVCRPAGTADEAPCARRIISTLARRAFRRPVTGVEVQDLFNFYEAERKDGGFDAGIQMALRALLMRPEFLFRTEREPAGATPGTAHRISDIELASRLSFFLWSSIPDDELLDLAARGQLSEQATLERQVRRMLSDRRSQALLTNFAGQWLYLRNLQQTVPNLTLFPDFDDNLRQAMRRETELLFESIVREDRSVLDLLTADYTFVNERLARHYGIPNIYGSHFRRVALRDGQRGGLLGQASILTVTSYATRTSPVQRGKWVLDNILGTPPPAPPPDVPPLEEGEGGGAVLTMRQRMERHRANPVCAVCHSRMDPIGLSLEYYDAVGRLRVPRGRSSGGLDVSGVMPDGTAFDGAAGLKELLATRADQVVLTVAERLLTYSLGRGLEHYDAPAVRTIVRNARARKFTMSSLVLGVVNSTPFRMRKASEAAPGATAVAAIAR